MLLGGWAIRYTSIPVIFLSIFKLGLVFESPLPLPGDAIAVGEFNNIVRLDLILDFS